MRAQRPVSSRAVESSIESSGISAPLFAAAVAACTQLLEFTQAADASLSTFFRMHRSGARDRVVIAEAAWAVLRRWRWLQSQTAELPAASRLRMQVALAMVRLCGVSLRQIEAALKPAERDWLLARRLHVEAEAESHAPQSLAEQLDFPDWLIERLGSRFAPADLLALARGLNAPAALDLRVNLTKTDRSKALARLAADGISVRTCSLAPMGLRVSGRPALQKHPLFLDGSIEVQDEGSQLLGHLLQPRRGELVIDFCAGAGGKTLLLGAMMRSTGRLYAFDIAEKRLAKLKVRAARASLSNVHPICISGENDIRVKRLAGKADRVLVDAPCSGLGTLRRNPDLKWRQTAQGIVELCAKQTAILNAAARLVKPGGRLVYATCSILDEENQQIVSAFLATHPEFRRISAEEILAAQGIGLACGESMQLYPHQQGTDGFYASVLERAA